MSSIRKYPVNKGKKVTKINNVNCKAVKLYCNKKCNKQCFISKIESQHILKVSYMNTDFQKATSCFLKYQINKINNKRTYPYISEMECLIEISLRKGSQEIQLAAVLDTGAQVSCISNDLASKLVSKGLLKLRKANRKLVGANNENLNCLGVIGIQCKIGNKLEKVDFFVLKNCSNVLLGLPAIKKFNILIKPKGYSFEKTDSIRAILCDETINTVTNNQKAYLATPAMKYTIHNLKTIKITLNICGKRQEKSAIQYKDAEVYDCLCLTDNTELCETCRTNGPLGRNTILGRGQVEIKYRPPYLHDLTPREDFFQIKILEESKINIVEAEPAAFTYNEIDGLGYDKGGFVLDSEENSKELYPVSDVDPSPGKLNKLIRITPEPACCDCKIRGLVFCNYRNQTCQSFLQYKQDIGMKNSTKCTIINMDHFKGISSNEALVVHIQSGINNIKKFLLKEGVKMNEIKTYLTNKTGTDNKLQAIQMSSGTKTYFILTGTVSVLNIETLLTQTCQVLSKEKVKTLHILDMALMEVSEWLLERVFNKLEAKIKIYNKWLTAVVNRVSQNGREIKATLEEEIDFKSQLNVVIDCEEIRGKMLKLCYELNEEKNGLKALWSKSTHDIGLFKQREPPGYPIKFKFPIKPEMAGKPPTPIKTAFVSNKLLEQAKQMLDALEDAKIIKRGYSKFNARTHYILKPPKELTVTEWVEKGFGKAEDFIAGTLDNKGPLTIRMVHNFADLNERTINSPIYQPSTSEQLRRISPNIKYISVIDVTACFFSLLLDKESSEMTGFDSGVQRYQRYTYTRVPMGAAIAKTLQDSALLHAISDLGNFLIYSDDILVISESKWQHFEHVKNILIRLRQHGFKCKLSKANFFITKMVRIYGHIVDLANGTLSPDKDKLEALRSKPVPRTRKELKSFLGGLQFFSALLPIAGNTLAILNQATRGKTFKWEKEHQMAYEAIIKLLSNEGLILVHRGDEGRPFRVAIDTSEFHTSFVVFQVDENLDNRPIKYGIKTWASTFANHIPEYRELLGIVHTLNALESEFEHKKYPLIVYTDNLPLCLMNIAARFSKKIARIKLYIESLNWCVINWSPGTSEIIALPDYFSRQRHDNPMKTRQPKEWDTVRSREVGTKIDTTKLYSGPRSSFLIDSLISLPKEKFDSIRDKTATLDKDNKLVYVEELTKEKSKENTLTDSESNQNESKNKELNRVKLKVTNDEDTEEIGDLKHRKAQTRKNVRKQLNHNPTKIKKEEKGVAITYPDKMEEIVELTDVVEHKEKTQLKQGQELKGNKTENTQTLKEDEAEYIEILDYPNMINARESNIKMPGNKTHIKGNGSLARWYNNFINRAKYLDVEKLRQALEVDPHWNKIISICERQTKYMVGEKIYFICDKILVCKEQIKDTAYSYKICLPSTLAYDTVLMAHRQLLHAHGKKLVNQLNLYFEIRDIEKLVYHITKDCFVCGLNQVQPAGGNRPPVMKKLKLISRKCSTWFIDELQLVDKTTGRELAGFSKIIVAICGFTHFIIAEPIRETLTSESFLKFIQEKIIQVFGPCEAIVTDNDAKISSSLVQMACGVLGIRKLESLPYAPRGNLAELANKLILKGLRNETLSLYVNPKYFHILLNNVIYLINSLTFFDAKTISPYLLMFAQQPKQDILQIYSKGAEKIIDKNEYLEHLLLINDVYTKMRLAMIDKRQYNEDSRTNTNYRNNLQPGDIVMIRNPEKTVQKANHKFRPLYKNKFVIIRRTATSAFLRPLENIYLKNFENMENAEKVVPDFAYKADISLLKKVSHMTLLHTNKVKEYYEHFMETNSTPPAYYMLLDQEGKNGSLRTWDELNNENNEIINELKEAEEVIPNKGHKIQAVKPCIKEYRQKMIEEISTKFRELQKGERSEIKAITIRKIAFNPVVRMRALIKSKEIYFCKKPKDIKLNEDPASTLRTINVEGKTYFCYCKACSKQLEKCLTEPCEKCFGTSINKQYTQQTKPDSTDMSVLQKLE